MVKIKKIIGFTVCFEKSTSPSYIQIQHSMVSSTVCSLNWSIDTFAPFHSINHKTIKVQGQRTDLSHAVNSQCCGLRGISCSQGIRTMPILMWKVLSTHSSDMIRCNYVLVQLRKPYVISIIVGASKRRWSSFWNSSRLSYCVPLIGKVKLYLESVARWLS